MLCYECVVYSTQSVKSVRLFERKLTYSTYRVQQYSTVQSLLITTTIMIMTSTIIIIRRQIDKDDD